MLHIQNIIFSDMVVGEKISLTMAEFMERYAIDPAFFNELLDYGLIEAQHQAPEKIELNTTALQRIESASRLRRDLDVNVPGIALVLDLLDELQHARGELQILRRQIGE